MQIDFDLLRSFVEVARATSFSAAARRRGVTQPAISQQMKTLEGHLGVPLFEKVGRYSRLNEAGKRLFARIADDFSHIEDSLEDFRDRPARVRGQVRIGTPGPFPKRWLRPRLPQLIERYPELDLELVSGLSKDVEKLLVLGKIELSFYFGFRTSAQIESVPIAEEEIVAVASPEYLRRKGEPRSIQDLKENHVFIVNREWVFRPWWKEVFGSLKTAPSRVRCTVIDMEEMLYFARQSAGITVLPTYFVGSHIQSGELKPLPLQRISKKLRPSYRKPIFLAWRKATSRSANVRAVRDALLDTVDQASLTYSRRL